IGGVVLVIAVASGGRYRRWERIVLGLAVFNGLFLAAALLSRTSWPQVGHAFATWQPLPSGPTNTVLLLIASTIGATVTPWMVFFQQSAAADKGMTRRDVRHGRLDTALGAVLAAVFGCGALIAGAALFGHGGDSIQGLAGAGFPAALAGVSGHAVATIFALGLIEAGAVAVLTISASTAYAAAECVGVAHSFNIEPRKARLFLAVNIAAALVAATVILIPHAPLLAIALNANVLATVLLPVTLIFLMMLANDRTLMGHDANRRVTNVVAGVIVGLITLAALAYAIDSFLQSVHLLPSTS
ncbi:MAG TPA: divalent metal cation transporter, partial [Mycobacterium sp.]|nr:divalent metal cation transporter [Mycobacterium sp.]